MYSKATILQLLLLVPFALAVPAAKSKSSESSKTASAPDSAGTSASNISTGNLSGEGASGIDYTHWELQLPVGAPNKPDTVPGAKLSTYSDPKKEYFYTEGGVVIMKVPGSPEKTDCVHTPNSLHCRTELVERNPSSWDPKAATNSLSATLTVVKADDSKYGTCIGQIHIDDSVSSKPVAELYYNSQGKMTFGVEQTRAGGNEKTIPIETSVPLGTKFSYEITYQKNILGVAINGGKMQVFDTYSLDAPASYFKAGNYNQGDDASEVHFFAISLKH